MSSLQGTCTSSNLNNKLVNEIIGINELCELSLLTSPTTQSVLEESDLELWPSVYSHNDISHSTSTSYPLSDHININPNQPNSPEGNPINLDLTI